MPQAHSIRRQLTRVILFTSGAVLLLTCSALFAYQYFVLRDSALTNLSTLAAVIANNSTAALAFNNADDARTTLSAVKAEPGIVAAALYDREGALFAKYPDTVSTESLPSPLPPIGSHFSGEYLNVVHPVSEDGKAPLGALYLQSNMESLYVGYRLYAAIVAAVLLVSGALAYFLSAKLQQQITKPILALTETATAISVARDYSVRAPASDRYEVGLLTDAFNQMLGRIQAQVGSLDLLQRITRGIAERQDLQSIARIVITNLEDNMPIDFGCLCVYNPTEETVTVVGVGKRSEPLAKQAGLADRSRVPVEKNGLSRCVRGKLVYEPDITGIDFQFPRQLSAIGMRSVVIAPLLVESTIFGVLVAARKGLLQHVALSAHQTQMHGALQQAYEDLRQSQQTVMQQERLRALGQMASGIAHDINNAISPVSLYTESLLEREPNLSERARGYLVTIQQAIEDVANTVARMREFYRNRTPELVLTTLSLDKLAQQVIELTRARWSDLPQEHGVVIKLQTDFAADLPKTMGAEAEIRDALTNLVFNAVDAMPQGGTLLLRTRLLRKGTDGGSSPETAAVAIEVCDTGIGMNSETRQRCLEPFFTTKGERGTGLGLAMVYGMVQRHSAELEIDSLPGRGTTIRLIFPIDNTTVPATGQVSAPPRITQRRRILIVDDDPLLIKSLRDALEADGHVVLAANGGQEGIDAFIKARKESNRVDLVFTDLGMPYVDGRKVAASIKAESPATPVVMLTGWGQRLIDDNETPEHVDRVLSKPPRLHELRAALADFASDTAYLQS